jgi:hypothetical protein
VTKAASSRKVPSRLAARMFFLRANRTTRLAARERRKKLERELACYRTTAERADLFAMLDRYPDGMTHEVREILNRQARNDLWGGGRFIRPY